MKGTYAILDIKDEGVSTVVCKQSVTGQIEFTHVYTEPLPINGDPKLRAQAIGTVILAAINHGATSIEITEKK